MSVSDDLVLHMRRVQTTERDLRDLGVVWQMIESSAAIGCPEEAAHVLPTLASARERFGDLQGRLIAQMAEDSMAELGDELTAKAQCAIDILVRNLYERTADVGFLATDALVRDFCAAASATQADERGALRERLREYQAKYSVYDDVILLSPAGELLLRLDAAGDGLAASRDPIVAEAVQRDGHVERFRVSDLAADAAPALLYAHRITEARSARVLGVLVLRFRFHDEMQRIFAGIADERRHLALVLVDEQRRVIVSNDEAHVPVGVRLATTAGGVELCSFAGREYVAVTCATHGYQGYRGPGWRAQAMVSLLTAFRQPPELDAESADIPLDNPQLNRICVDADAINRELRRVVWNGRLSASAAHGDQARLKGVLQQVGIAGMRTRERVDLAIRDLYRTSMSRARRQSIDLARLAADILDRNLYERANDCRWWALSPAIRQALAAPAGDAAAAAGLKAVLDHVNGLYTVYSRLVVFDAEGAIRGASNDAAGALDGRAVEAAWLQAVRGLKGSQAYAVTPFEDTALHDAGPTYVYLAAVHDGGGAVRGGVAVIFHAARELQAMLGDVVGERRAFAAFVDEAGTVLASNQPELTAGLRFEAAEGLTLLEHGGVHWACARVRATGYREFKTVDGHRNGVSAVVGLRLGATERRRTAYSEMALRAAAPAAGARSTLLELAVFQIGAGRYALPAAALLEAVPLDGLVRTPRAAAQAVGMLEVQKTERPRLVQVMCGRQLIGAHYPPRATDGVVLVLRSPQVPALAVLGMRADEVLTVLEVDRRRIGPVPAGVAEFAPWVAGVVDCEVASREGDHRTLVQLLDVEALLAHWLPGWSRPAAGASPMAPTPLLTPSTTTLAA